MFLVAFDRPKNACSVQVNHLLFVELWNMASVAFDAYAGEQGSDLFEMYIYFAACIVFCFDAKTTRKHW